MIGSARFSGIMPKEVGSTVDPAKQMVGTGPWILDGFDTGSKLRYSRNPDWHLGPDRPYMDKMTCNIVADPTAKLNFFLGGSLDTLDARGVDLAPAVSVKAKAAIFPDAASTWGLMMQEKDVAPNAPWKDARVRQAMSMALDRDALFEAANQASLAKAAGFEVPTLWPSHIGSSPLLGLDAKKDLDADSAAFFQYNPQKAKALLAEAGYPNGFELQIERNKGTYGDQYDNVAEALPPMLQAVGIKPNVVIRDHPSWFAIKNQLGVFDQAQIYVVGAVWQSPVQDLLAVMSTGGTSNVSHFSDAQMDSMIKALLGKDDATIKAGLKSIGNYAAKQMWTIPVYVRMNYYLYQANLGGAGDYYTFSADYSDPDKDLVRFWRKG
jgi:ABC-type transport system substrate-binding protein